MGNENFLKCIVKKFLSFLFLFKNKILDMCHLIIFLLINIENIPKKYITRFRIHSHSSFRILFF